MRFTDNFQVSPDSFGLIHVSSASSQVGIHINVQDDLLQDFELLAVLIHPDQLL